MRRAAQVALAASLVTLGLKGTAYALTGSLAILSDAAEGLVNLVTALMVMFVVRVATKPADEDHPFGHDKAEFFAAGIEGALILLTALAVLGSGLIGLADPPPLAPRLDWGVWAAVVATGVNAAAAIYLRREGQRSDSITLSADADHLWTDVVTTIAVLIGLGLAVLTGWRWLDPLTAVLVGLHILRSGTGLVGRSLHGLMDRALPEHELNRIGEVLDGFRAELRGYHAIRTRQAGQRRFIDAHLVVIDTLTVRAAHDLTDRIEAALRDAFPQAHISLHIEPHVPGAREGFYLRARPGE